MNPFAEILKVAEDMKLIVGARTGPPTIPCREVLDFAARLRAAASPEAVAFWEAAMGWCAVVETDSPTAGMATLTTKDWAAYLIRLKAAYRALVARAKTEGGK